MQPNPHSLDRLAASKASTAVEVPVIPQITHASGAADRRAALRHHMYSDNQAEDSRFSTPKAWRRTCHLAEATILQILLGAAARDGSCGTSSDKHLVESIRRVHHFGGLEWLDKRRCECKAKISGT